MLEFAEEPKAVVILDENGKPLTGGDNERRFFEASWMHKYNGKYYYFDAETGLMLKGWNKIGNYTYFFKTDGSAPEKVEKDQRQILLLR